MAELRLPDAVDADDLGAFVARAVRLDSGCAIRLRARDSSRLDVWAGTPFDVLATRSADGVVEPADVTVDGNELLAGLAVVGGTRIDLGPSRDLLWRAALPPVDGWRLVEVLPASVLAELADRGLGVARENAGPRGTPPAALLDQDVLTVTGGGFDVKVPLRCLFALSGMGFLLPAEQTQADDVVRVFATDAWLRIDARFGAVVRRRHALLPLLF